MPFDKQLEFSLIHYIPNVVNGEFVNIGVILFDDDGGVHLRFTHDWRRVRALDPAADIETLEALESDLDAQLTRGVLDRPTLLTKLQDYLTSGIEITRAQGVLAEDAASELETLARIYLERRRAGVRESSGRAAIFASMKTAFEEAGVWRHMRHRIAASQYTHRGDPLKIDCGYRPNGIIKLFQAVSLENDTDAAKVLAFSYPGLRDGIFRTESAKTELTAIVEPDLDRNDDQIAFALAVLAKTDIAVASTSELRNIAARAAVDLRV
jgi:Protein of unknown function (DUF3037)